MAANSKKRSQNYSDTEKEMFLHALEKYKHILECHQTDSTVRKHKLEAWKYVQQYYNANVRHSRTVEQLQQLRRNLRKKARAEKALKEREQCSTGSGPLKKIEHSILEQVEVQNPTSANPRDDDDDDDDSLLDSENNDIDKSVDSADDPVAVFLTDADYSEQTECSLNDLSKCTTSFDGHEPLSQDKRTSKKRKYSPDVIHQLTAELLKQEVEFRRKEHELNMDCIRKEHELKMKLLNVELENAKSRVLHKVT